MNLEQLRNEWRTEILRLANKHGARNIRVFGSIARGEGRGESDLDLLVEMEPGRSLLDLIGFSQDLEDLLGCHVDVLTDGGVHPLSHDRIYGDAVPL